MRDSYAHLLLPVLLAASACVNTPPEGDAQLLGAIPSSSKADGAATGGWEFAASGVEDGRGVRIALADDPSYGVEINTLAGGSLIEFYFPDGSQEIVEAATGHLVGVVATTTKLQTDVATSLDRDLDSYLAGKADAIQDFYQGDLPAILSQCVGVFTTLAECKRTGQYDCTVLANSRASITCAMRLQASAPAQPSQQDPSFRLVNRSDREILEVYTAAQGASNWSRDMLGSSILPPNNMFLIRLPRGECMQNIRVVMSGASYEKRNINTCALTDVSFPQDF